MSKRLNQEVIKKTKLFLEYIESNKKELQKDKYLFSSFLEICKVLDSSIVVIENNNERRIKRKSRKQLKWIRYNLISFL